MTRELSAARKSLPSEVPLNTGVRPIIEPIASLKRHPGLAIGAALLTLLPVLALVRTKTKPKYSAEAVVYVSPTFIKTLSEDHEQETQFYQYATFIQHQVKTVDRFDVISAALTSLGKRKSVWQRPGEGDREAVERLQESLVVTRIPDTYQISISLEGGEPDGLADIVNAVAATFVDSARKDEFYGRPERLQALSRERDKLMAVFEEKSNSRTQLTREFGFVTLPSGGPNPYDELLLRRKEELALAQKARIDAEARLASVDGSQTSHSDGALGATAAEIVAGDTGLASLKSSLNRRRSELLTQLSGLAPNTPLRKGAEQELAAIDAELERASSKVMQQTSKQVLDRFGGELRRTQMVEKRLQADTDRLTAQARDFASKVRDASELGLELEQIRNRVNAVNTRIEYLTLEGDAPGFLRIFSLARPPSHPSKDNSRKLFALAFVAALFAGLLMPIGFDLLDTRVGDAASIEKVLGFSPLGIMTEDGGLNFERGRDHAVRLAVAIERAMQRTGARTFFLTGVKSKSGTSFLTAAMARELVLLGRRVLIVKANSQELVHEPGPGLVQLLRQEAKLNEVLGAAAPGQPSRLLLGDEGGKRNLPALARMRELLLSLSRQFDAVLVDGAPIPSSADSEYFAGVCDATILVIPSSKVTRPQLENAVALLRRLQIGSVGAILTRVGARARSQAAHRPAMASQSARLDFPDAANIPETRIAKDMPRIPTAAAR